MGTNFKPAVVKKGYKLGVSLILIGLTLFIYLQTANFGFVVFDDGLYVTDNHEIQAPINLKSFFWAFTTTQAANWHPLTWLSYLLDFQLFGLNAGGYHLTSVLFHLTNSVLLFLFFEKMTGSLWPSALTAALFAVHPLHVESVAWISERKDVISGFFWILTLGAYGFYVKRPALLRYLMVLVLFLAGLMAKPMVVTLPCVMLLLDFWPLGRCSSWLPKNRGGTKTGDSFSFDNQGMSVAALILEKAPFFMLAAASSAMTFYAQQSVGAVNLIIPFTTRFSNALISYGTYLIHLFWPENLSIFYPYPAFLPIWQIMGSGLILVLISIGVFWNWKQYPYLVVGWLWYLGTLVPVIGLIQVGSQAMADRYTYIPLIGLFIMTSWAIPELLAKWHYRKVVLSGAAMIWLLALTTLAWKQTTCWENSISLFQQALRVSAGNFKAHDMLGLALTEQGKLDQAIFHLQESIRIKPNYGSAYNNLGRTLEKKGEWAEAQAQYLKALKVQEFPEAHYNLGIVMLQQGKLETAVSHFQSALRINTNYAEAYNNLGVTLYQQGKSPEAINHFNKALKIKPFFLEAHYNLGTVLNDTGRFDEAIEHFQEALRIQPAYARAYNNLGLAQARKGRIDEAIASFQRGLDHNPVSPEIRENLKKWLLRRGKER